MIELDWLKIWARTTPAAIALHDLRSDRALSYRELFELCQFCAVDLQERFELKAGDRVALLAKNSWMSVALFFSLQRLGVILVPINLRLTTREIEHIVADASPKAILADRDLMAAHQLDTRAWGFDTDFAALLAQPRLAIKTFADVPFDHPCMIMYTSGTTGKPKGAILTHQMLFWNSINTTLRLNISQSDKHIAFLPFFHTGGWNVLVTPFLHRGATTLILEKFDADAVLKYSEQHRATLLFGVPTMLEMMARSKDFAEADLSSVRYAIVGGEPMPVPLIQKWQHKGIPVRQGYGLTEFGPNVFSLNEEDSLRKIGSIGFPNFYIETRVITERGLIARPHEVGELQLRGPMCTPGYWNNPQATAETIQDQWLCTGDLVRFDDEGYFYIAGRKKDMFISGGENVYPTEVEHVLRRHPAVREAAVIGVPDAKWGEVGRAFVARQAPVTDQELREFCQGRLARFKIPKSIVFLAELPKGHSGKILKRALLDKDLLAL